jgi:aryl-alcohol dehydrogenase-like predicted oxidoreductase
MKQRRLGKGGPMVGEIGLGALSFGGLFGPTTEGESHRALDKALDLGVTHLDTALIYGPHISENVIGSYFVKNPSARKRFSVATKGGFRINPRGISNEAGFLRECLEGSLQRLGVDHVDLYYIHRRDQSIPIEDVTGTLARFIAEGKIGGIGFSEIAPSSLRRASSVHHIRAVQNEYSLATRLPELGLLEACEELGTAFVAFSPVFRGAFSDVPFAPKDLPDDFRRSIPRFTDANFVHNAKYIEAFRTFAQSRGWPAAALANAWVLKQGQHIIPIPGTRQAEHLAECAEGSKIDLSTDDLAELNRILPIGWAHGNRYSMEQQGSSELYC